MAVRPHLTVWCDNCPDWADGGHWMRKSKVRSEVCKRGWVTVRKGNVIKDYCPQCASDLGHTE